MTTIGTVVGRLVTWIDRLMPPGPRRDALTGELATHFGDDDSPVTPAGCAEVERRAWTVSRHVALIHEPASPADLPDGSSPPPENDREPAWPPPDPADVRRRAGGVTEVRRLSDGTGLVRVDSLDAVGLAQPYLDAAFTMLRGAERIVLDLRANGGGDPATVALIAGWLLGDTSVKLSDVVYRTHTRQWWTPDRPPGTALRQDAWVLVGPGTFSSGEALAYHLRSHGRVTVVGTTTPGAADHVLPVRLAPTVLAHVPNASVVDAVSGGNWEGSGVAPDVECPPERALDVACQLS
ncbi:S41 family peptidase [Virgisporangium ochraceum]|uniref:S41 family peptidase n=1 Tax=Virgisporangium ochraceum TaxID=65505 RepID=UPI001940DB45|nr:S41 family peptidase [Virgisporangium ochraceum]